MTRATRRVQRAALCLSLTSGEEPGKQHHARSRLTSHRVPHNPNG
jgi:hypothetical protein